LSSVTPVTFNTTRNFVQIMCY